MLKLVFPMMLAAAAGISLVVQLALNANLRTALGSAAWSGFMSYFIGVICMAALALPLQDPVPSASIAARIPWFAWSGGLFGAPSSLGSESSWSLSSAPRPSSRFSSRGRCSARSHSTILACWVFPFTRSVR